MKRTRTMTDYELRCFATSEAVRAIGTGLIDRTLPRDLWTHEAHLAACLWLIVERRDIAPEADLPAIIRSYNESVGGVNDDTQGYHETLTQLYIAGVRSWIDGHSIADELVDRVNRLLASPIGQRNWPLTLYKPELLFSVAARRGLVAPDIGIWPRR